MARRLHVPSLRAVGTIDLPDSEAHHARDVLRLKLQDAVELFDDAGQTATAIIEHIAADRVTVSVVKIVPATERSELIVAAAVPKGDRADWMIEKLSELGVSRYIPLAAARSVVLPEGKNKRERWKRIATEAAKQSRRAGVMQIDDLAPLAQVVADHSGQSTIFLSTEVESQPLTSISKLILDPAPLVLLVGPEGGWTDDELALFARSGLTSAKLTQTILRVETAAIAAVAIVAAMRLEKC